MFIVPSATFQLPFVMLILAHDRHKIVRFDVTKHPTAGWLSRQVTEAFPWDTAPRFLLRDRGLVLRSRIQSTSRSDERNRSRERTAPQNFIRGKAGQGQLGARGRQSLEFASFCVGVDGFRAVHLVDKRSISG